MKSKNGKDFYHPVIDGKIPSATIPKEFIKQIPNYSPNAVKIFVFLSGCLNYELWGKEVKKSRSEISKGTGIKSPETISSAILELTQAGWIGAIKHVKNDCNIYTINEKAIINEGLVQFEISRREHMRQLKNNVPKNIDEKSKRFLPMQEDGKIPSTQTNGLEDGKNEQRRMEKSHQQVDGNVPSHINNNSNNKSNTTLPSVAKIESEFSEKPLSTTDRLFNHITKKYGAKRTPPLEKSIQSALDGTHKQSTRPMKPEHLLAMWDGTRTDRYLSGRRKDIEEGFKSALYDLSVLVSRYEEYLSDIQKDETQKAQALAFANRPKTDLSRILSTPSSRRINPLDEDDQE